MPKGILGRPTIICLKCGERKEHYAEGQCKSCYWQQYYQKHRKEAIQRQKEWRIGNREQHKAYNHLYRQEHSEEKKLYARRYYQKYRKEELARYLRWAKENPGKVNEYNRRWRRKNPLRMVIYATRRRIRKVQANGYSAIEQILARIKYYGGLCYICGGSYEEIDHVIPLSKGGSNWPANLRPICKSCNSRKGAKSLQVLQSYGKKDKISY